MKVEADILGVEQAVDFHTMETAQFVVLDIFGVTLRVPITEEQMEQLTRQVVGRKSAPSPQAAFDETREVSEGLPPDLVSEDIPEREHSMSDQGYGGVMAGLTDDAVVEADAEVQPSGILDGFFDESDEEKARKLRERKPQRRTVPRDEAGNPVVDPRPSLPAVQGFNTLSDDDGFAQG